MTDDLDEPESEDWGLVFPFVVCETHGGPYADDPFVAGYQAGQIEKTLATAAAIGADRARFTVRTPLVPQIELIAMHHGFTAITAEPWGEHPDEWTFMTVATSVDDPAVGGDGA